MVPCPVLCVTCPLVFKALAHKTLVLLLGVDPSRQLDHPLPTVHPQVTYAYMKNMWKSARKVCPLPPPNRGHLMCSLPGVGVLTIPTVLGLLLSQRESQQGRDTRTFGQTDACSHRWSG